MTCVQHFLLKECFAFDQTFWPTMLDRLTPAKDLHWRDIPSRVIASVTSARKESYCYSKL